MTRRTEDPGALSARWKLTPAQTARLATHPYFVAAAHLEPYRLAPRVSTWRELRENPTALAGRRLEGEAVVTKVISDRGFYVRTPDGDEMFAVVREDVPGHEMIDIDAGQTITFTAEVQTNPAELDGVIEKDTMNALRDARAFLQMRWDDVTIVDQG